MLSAGMLRTRTIIVNQKLAAAAHTFALIMEQTLVFSSGALGMMVAASWNFLVLDFVPQIHSLNIWAAIGICVLYPSLVTLGATVLLTALFGRYISSFNPWLGLTILKYSKCQSQMDSLAKSAALFVVVILGYMIGTAWNWSLRAIVALIITHWTHFPTTWLVFDSRALTCSFQFQFLPLLSLAVTSTVTGVYVMLKWTLWEVDHAEHENRRVEAFVPRTPSRHDRWRLQLLLVTTTAICMVISWSWGPALKCLCLSNPLNLLNVSPQMSAFVLTLLLSVSAPLLTFVLLQRVSKLAQLPACAPLLPPETGKQTRNTNTTGVDHDVNDVMASYGTFRVRAPIEAMLSGSPGDQLEQNTKPLSDKLTQRERCGETGPSSRERACEKTETTNREKENANARSRMRREVQTKTTVYFVCSCITKTMAWIWGTSLVNMVLVPKTSSPASPSPLPSSLPSAPSSAQNYVLLFGVIMGLTVFMSALTVVFGHHPATHSPFRRHLFKVCNSVSGDTCGIIWAFAIQRLFRWYVDTSSNPTLFLALEKLIYAVGVSCLATLLAALTAKHMFKTISELIIADANDQAY